MKRSDYDYVKGTVWCYLSKNIPRTKNDLAYLAGIEPREVKAIIHDLRYNDKKIICSGNAGYWLPQDKNDPAISKTLKRLKSQRDKMSALIAVMEKYDLEGQMTFEEVSA